ncbi:MAG: radical SAM/SPASM domain-containing protein [Sedimentisphaerales bacterium]
MKGFEELTLELTDWCPSECLHCSSGSGPICTNSLSRELALRLIDEAGRLGAAKVSLGGGEPTASDSFFPVARRVLESGMLLEVFTCGLAKTTHGITSLPPTIIENCAGLKDIKFIFSFHGATAQTHDYITQTPRSYNCLFTSLKDCLQAGIECEMNFVPLRVNVHEFTHLVKLAQDLQITRISVLRFVPQGRGALNRKELELCPEEEDLFVNEVLRLRAQSSVDIRTGSPFNGIVPGNKVPCRAGFGKLVVQADGNVLPCEVFKRHDRCQWGLSVHNMTLSQIVESPQVSDLHNRIHFTNCLECPVHGALRNNQKAGGYHAVSKTFVQAQ